jgi:hypothetical protein
MKKALLTLAIVSSLMLTGLILPAACGTQQTVVKVTESVNLPKRMKIVAQSCDANVMYQTVIDLENNEVVILIYNELNLMNVIRTGIQADPDKQSRVTGIDAPALARSQERLRHKRMD